MPIDLGSLQSFVRHSCGLSLASSGTARSYVRHQHHQGHGHEQARTTPDPDRAKQLGIETLETRRSDSLDFHDVAVWCVRDALEAAFNAGVEQGQEGHKSDKANT
jgi:hypothetical protein